MDACMPNHNSKECADHVNETLVNETIKSTCFGQKECTFNVNMFLFNKTQEGCMDIRS